MCGGFEVDPLVYAGGEWPVSHLCDLDFTVDVAGVVDGGPQDAACQREGVLELKVDAAGGGEAVECRAGSVDADAGGDFDGEFLLA